MSACIRVARRGDCRLCGGRDLELVLPLAPTPIADDFVPEGRRREIQQIFPLEVWLCHGCGHTQLLDAVDPEALFGSYTYETKVSLGLVEHFGRLAARLIPHLPPGAFVCEIGSNDGSMLRFFREAGHRVLGVDPAREIARRATASGIETLPEPFSAALGAAIRRERGPASLVIANNVFAHVDALGDVAEGIRALLADDGVFVFEVSYMADILERMLFDTIYHEHLCYHAVRPFAGFFERHGLAFFDVERIPTKGGSLRGFVQRAGGPRAAAPQVGSLMRLEEQLGLGRAETYRAYGERIAALRDGALEAVESFRRAGGEVAGYGASATVTTLLHHFDLGRRLAFLVDDNPVKQGTFSPGHHLPVLHPAALQERRPAAVVLLAWAYAEPILARCGDYRGGGGRCIVPAPAVRVL